MFIRDDFIEMICDSLTADEIWERYHYSKDQLQEGQYNWNESLEYDYQEMEQTMNDDLYHATKAEIDNMPCDTYGECACSSKCPQYYHCCC